MLFLCLGFVLFGWLSAVYGVFPACTLYFHLRANNRMSSANSADPGQRQELYCLGLHYLHWTDDPVYQNVNLLI